MAQHSQKSIFYRTKDEIAVDLAAVLNSDLHKGTQLPVVIDACRTWTDLAGARKGCEFWTPKALECWQNRVEITSLRLEHAVPLKVIRELLFALPKPVTAEVVKQVLEPLVIGVVVHKLEDAKLSAGFRQKMPEEFDSTRDPWLRYKRIGLLVNRCTWDGPSVTVVGPAFD